MTTRSVSFGEVEEQVYEHPHHPHEEEEEEVAEDYFEEEEEEDPSSSETPTTVGGASASAGSHNQKSNNATTSNANNLNSTSSSNRGTTTTTTATTTANNNAAVASSSSLICPNCGSKDIEQHDASGASVCTECGVVVEENAIVSAVEFVEGAGGASSMVGQFVSATSSKAYTGGGATGPGAMMRGGRYGFSKDSRETTLANGRRRIQDVASRLRLGSHYVDAAHRLFTVAVEKNFVQGRRTTHVVAACLYIACRQEKSQHMLIDFSDALQVNVYTLGTTFLKFRRLLGLKLEIIDPALYVYRFAAHLDLDEKANAVALTALRLVGRMKRDWIVAGRRPAGICAAALLIAARAHGFSRHHQDVTRILRVCGMTVTTRVKEFEQTPTASLTLHQFNNVELDSEADPPIYTKNKIREARAKAIQENNIQLLTSGALDDPALGKKAKRWREKKTTDRQVQFQELYESIESELLTQQKTDDDDAGEKGDDDESGTPPEKEKPGQLKDDNANEGGEHEKEDDTATNGNKKTSPATGSSEPQEQQQLVVHSSSSTQDKSIAENPQWTKAYPKSSRGTAIVLPDHATEEERQEPTAPVEAKLSLSEWKESMPDESISEIESMFRSEEEVAQKEAIFNKINKDYLEQQERKENDRLTSEAAVKDQEEEYAAQAEGHMRYMKSNRGRKRKKSTSDKDVSAGVAAGEGELTTEEALIAAVSTRKISRKINYDAMSAIFDDDGTFSTDVPQAVEEHSPDPTFGIV